MMKRFLIAFGLCLFSVPAWAVCGVSNLQVKDNLGTTALVPYADDGSGGTNCSPQVQIKQGGNTVAVKAASTAAAQTDPAAVVRNADIGTQADAACGTDNGTCSAIALIKRGNQTSTTIATNTGGSIPAGENHGEEVGSNQIRVQVAQTVTAASAYSSGNAVGGLMTIAGAARVSGALGAGGSGGILQNVAVNSKSVQTAAMEVWIFDANPSGSTCTDKTAFVLATADFDKVIGVAAVPTTVSNNSGWFSGGTGSVGQANNQAMAYDLSSATSLFACMVTRGTPTFTATTDISLKYNLLRN